MGAGRPPRQVLSECCEERHGAPNPLPDAGIARQRSIERRRLVHSRAHTHVLVQRTFLGLRLEAKPCSRYQSYRCGKNSSGAFSLRASHTVGVTRKAVDSPILCSDFLTRALKATQGNATRGGLARRLQGCGRAGHETGKGRLENPHVPAFQHHGRHCPSQTWTPPRHFLSWESRPPWGLRRQLPDGRLPAVL